MEKTMSEVMQTRLSRTAVLAFVLGLSALSPLSIVTALPAIYFGIQAIRTINCGDGQLRGRRLAIAGLTLGALVTLVLLIGLPAMMLLLVQETNLKAGCQNNLRQLGTAINSYSNHNDHYFPPGTVLNPALPPERRLSWQAALMPFLVEGGPVGKKGQKPASAIDFEKAWDSPANAGLRHNVAPFLCPVWARELLPDQIGLTSYVGIAGVGRDAAVVPLEDANAGFFGYERRLRASDISALLSATMAAGETLHENGPWPAGGPPTVRGLAPDGDRYIGKGAAFGGLHRAGANILSADGSVPFVTEQIAPELFRSNSLIARNETAGRRFM